VKLQWLVLGAGLALVLAVLTRGALPPAGDTGVPLRAPGGQEAVPENVAESDRIPPPPARDIFRYAEPPPRPRLAPTAARPRTGLATPEPEPEPTPTPPLVRLVGLVRRADGLRAAVATAAGVAVVGPGDVVEGFAVVSLDEDRGLRLRAADGREIVLQPGG
jgi:hypothetical protein